MLTLAVPPMAPAVNRLVALPLDVGAIGAANVPSVPENAAIVPSGIVPPDDVSALEELNVRSAVTADEENAAIVVGVALTPSTRYGLVDTGPETSFDVSEQPGPPVPGPKLQPHQLSMAFAPPLVFEMAAPVAA